MYLTYANWIIIGLIIALIAVKLTKDHGDIRAADDVASPWYVKKVFNV